MIGVLLVLTVWVYFAVNCLVVFTVIEKQYFILTVPSGLLLVSLHVVTMFCSIPVPFLVT